MAGQDQKGVRGVVLDERTTITLGELCAACGTHAEVVIELVEEGIIEPVQRDGDNLHFHGYALIRARRAIRLVRDLRVNLPGAALVLDLLDELDSLRAARPGPNR
jgi:chaperone modulatory protein CbpM